jgi:hypothetical protein
VPSRPAEDDLDFDREIEHAFDADTASTGRVAVPVGERGDVV